jgi:hypothetical protein
VVALVRERNWTVLAIEVAITSESFGGTIDLVVRDGDGKILIVDLKTGRGIYKEMGVQLGAYAWLWRMRCAKEDRMHEVATEGAIIHAAFGEALAVHMVSAGSMAAGEQVFRKLLDIEEVAGRIEVGG